MCCLRPTSVMGRQFSDQRTSELSQHPKRPTWPFHTRALLCVPGVSMCARIQSLCSTRSVVRLWGPSDSSVYLYLKGGSLVQMLLIFHLKPGRVTTASINSWSIVPACPPSCPHPLLGSWLGLWAIGMEHLQGGTCPGSLLPVTWTGAPGSTASQCLGAY